MNQRTDRRENPRAPGRFKEALDATYSILRKHEDVESAYIWRELCADKWVEFVQEIREWEFRGAITTADHYFLNTTGISSEFPWFVDGQDRSTPLPEENE